MSKEINSVIYKRLIELEDRLKTNKTENTKKKLAKHINVSERTIKTYLDLLTERGMDIKRVDTKNESYYHYQNIYQTFKDTFIEKDDLLELLEFQALINNKKSIQNLPWIGNINARIEQSIDEKLANKINPILFFDEPNCINTRVQSYIDKLYQYIRNQECIRIEYKKFGEHKQYYKISPYFIKEHKHMWYIYGYNHSSNANVKYPCLALDRIESMESYTDQNYIPLDEYINPEKWFTNNLGITINNELLPLNIKFKIDKSLLNYLNSYPIDDSQKLNPEDLTLTVKLIHNYELEQWILGYSDQIEVLSPLSLREKIKERIVKQFEKYQ